MTMRHRARLAAQRVGLDLTPYPAASPAYQAFRAFTSSGPDVILDVGANDGGFARQCRRFGFAGEIVSFEPGSQAYARLTAASARDPHWTAVRLGLGDSPGEMTLHIAANAGASSSVLPMLPAHERAAPDSQFLRVEEVPIGRLDEWFAELPGMWERVALKIDTQGFERQVLGGAGALLDTRVVALQLELSLVPLYEGSWPWDEAVGWLKGRGFSMHGLAPGFTDPETGRLLQFDGVFVKGEGA